MDLQIYGEERGVYYGETGRVIIYLRNHETMDDLYASIQHEFIHKCIDDFQVKMDEKQEEDLIFQLSWAEYSLI